MNGDVGFKQLLESLAFTMASAITSSLIGSTVDAMFASHGTPSDTVNLLGLTGAQFLTSFGVAHEVYNLLLSMRPEGVPPPIGDAVPYYFLIESQPALKQKLLLINDLLRQTLMQKMNTAPAAAAATASSSQPSDQ